MPHDARTGPDPSQLHPLAEHPRVTFLRNLDLPPNVEVGAYSYYDDPAGPGAFLDNILYHFAFLGDRLVIGRFCAIAAGTRFLMNGGNHRLDAPSTYPFAIFGGAWATAPTGKFPNRGDTVIGNDVWLGYESTVLPGVTVGDGAVVAAKSVVSADVPPYAIVAGNPARVVRMRFSDADIAHLLRIAWWDWDADRITAHLGAIGDGDVDALEAATSA
ncbi:CatB-related O-acetyltransferase [Methylobacterium gregans]|uniref:Virginiamycin A acetyltransferase n=1 Tax=Methylobacterium gregans TaxID=374424 RepID=A0AA37HL50_9HYPH|nr:CatB-related O-acetyltransferase [Methylobacterium gregans]MDQ0520213.1 virginiamycin A acetyltransferase [Methylobacterium gregans]GJD77603.1 Virginiamycin A acetyltransferase [Methylobacterium gregans]GLS52615.1 acetyltransferase [Methylobacterium gregans]